MKKLQELKKHTKRMANAINDNNTEKTNWDYEGYKNTQHSGIENQIDWIQTLVSKINEVSLDKEYNCIICSSEVESIIEKLMFFNLTEQYLPNAEIFKKIGNIANKHFVYVDVYLPAHIILLVNENKFLAPELELDCNIIYIDNMNSYIDCKDIKPMQIIDAPCFNKTKDENQESKRFF